MSKAGRIAWGRGAVALALALSVGGCGGAGDVDTANNAQDIKATVKAEADAIMAPLAPPAPGSPGGLPIDKKPVEEGPIAPESAQGAAVVVQDYYAVLEQRKFAMAQLLWREGSALREGSEPAFAQQFAAFDEMHAQIGAPGDVEGAAGSSYVSVPVLFYGRWAKGGKPFYRLRLVTLKRVNDVPGSTPEQRQWRLDRIGPYIPPAPAGATENASGNASGD